MSEVEVEVVPKNSPSCALFSSFSTMGCPGGCQVPGTYQMVD
jgi:hypothetical protein